MNRPQRSNPDEPDCFEILGLPSSASVDEIAKAYRRLVITRHPDLGGDAREFHKLQPAYEACLLQAAKRPRISGQPSRDDFSPPPTQRLPLNRWARWGLMLAVGFALVTWIEPRVGLVGMIFLIPILLGFFVSQLPAGWSLAVAVLLVVVIAVSWWGAAAHMGWISYAWAEVSTADNQLKPAVTFDKRLGLIAAIATSLLSAFLIAVGCGAAFARDKT